MLSSLSEQAQAELKWHWDFWARPNQKAPDGLWNTWLVLAGRGFGKTRMGSEWIRNNVCGTSPLAAPPSGFSRIALVAETAADARDVMVLGDSGILACHPKDFRPEWSPTNRRLTWPNGVQAWVYNATEPDQLRGPQHHAAWVDELAKFRYMQEIWDQLQFGLRLGSNPQVLVSTTPRPIGLLKDIIKDPFTVITRGSTLENANNLAKQFIETIKRKYEGTRLGKQEIYAEMLDDVPGAMWTREKLDELRIHANQVPPLRRIVIAIDPAMTSGEDADETGIIAAGLGYDGHGYVLQDTSGVLQPNEWATLACRMYAALGGDRIIGETNNGGDMIENTIRAVNSNVAYKGVHASRGKAIRAEPISALYEQGRVHHVGGFSQLEDQMCAFTQDFDRSTAGYSPDRLDAMVWALTELMLSDSASTFFFA